MSGMSKRDSYVTLGGVFSAEQVDIIYTPISNRLTSYPIESAIENAWAIQLEAAKQKGMQLYDSEAYRLNAFQVRAGRLGLELAPISYKIHAAMKSLHGDPRISEQHLDKTLVVDSLLKTMDGKYIFGKVDKVVESAVCLIGGSCAKSRVEISSTADLFKYAQIRAAQVLGIAGSIVTINDLIGLIQNEVGCVNAIFDTTVALTADSILDTFHPSNAVSDLIVVDESRLGAYLAKGDGYIVAVAALLPSLTC
jgi:hypothetical protein